MLKPCFNALFPPLLHLYRSEIDPTPLYAAPSLKSMTEQALHHSNIHPAPYSQVPRSPSSSILSSLGDERVTGNKVSSNQGSLTRLKDPPEFCTIVLEFNADIWKW